MLRPTLMIAAGCKPVSVPTVTIDAIPLRVGKARTSKGM